MTTAEAAALCGVKPPTIRSWRHRGLLEPVGLDDHDRPLYAQLDVARAEARTRAKAHRTIAA
ncbi:helix-turn-helix domain-containing protein [Kitasatospora sp. NPDC054939]